MPSCSLIGCKSRYNKNQPHLTIHRLPAKEKLRAKWLEMIGPNKFKTKREIQHICSEHFTESCFNRTLNKITLQDDAYPTIFNWPPKVEGSPDDNGVQYDEKTSEEVSDPLILTNVESNINQNTPAKIRVISDKILKPPLDITSIINSPVVNIINGVHSPVINSKLDINHPSNNKRSIIFVNEEGKVISRSIALETDANANNHEQLSYDKERQIQKPLEQMKIAQLTRKLEKMAERRLEQRKRVKLLDRRCKFRDAKIAKLEAKIKELDVPKPKDLEAELIAMRDSLDEYAGPEGLLERQIRKKKGLPLDRFAYTPGLRKFALTLHCISAQAYNFVRESYGDCLPHPRTLMSWTLGDRPIGAVDTTQ